MINQRNISVLSNRLARSGRKRIPEAVLERDYCLAWFLVGLSRTRLCNQLVFKGGTALKRCYFADYRFSEDLDFSLAGEISFKSILAGLEDVYAKVKKSSGIAFDFLPKDRTSHLNSHSFYLSYEGPLPVASPKEVKVDITIKERFVFPIEERAVLQGYDEYADIPPGNKVRVYSLDEICVEKFLALTDRSRNEPRDLYDFWYLTSNKYVELSMLLPAINSKLEFRGRLPDSMIEDFKKKESRYSKLWNNRLSAQMSALPPFDDVFRSAHRAMRGAGLRG
jgi:uncharacterized protein